MTPAIKICGMTRQGDIDCAIDAGAAYLGLVFYPPSPRALTPEAASVLSLHIAGRVPVVGVFVNPDDAWLDEVLEDVHLDFIQLHGKETPARVDEVRLRTSCRIIKALPVSEAADVARAAAFEEAADYLLFDAKPPRQPAAIPGGNGLSFDWNLLKGAEVELPWFLAGGIDADNLARAVSATGARLIDVSSGVESAPGRKDHDRIRRLMAEAAAIGAQEKKA